MLNLLLVKSYLFLAKVLEINSLDSLHYEIPVPMPVEELEVVDEEKVDSDPEELTEQTESSPQQDVEEEEPPNIDDEGQTSLF